MGRRRRPDRASASRRRRPVPAGRDRPAATNGGAVTARAGRAAHARAHPSRGAPARQRHGRPAPTTSSACRSPASVAAGGCSWAWCSPTVRGSSSPGSSPRSSRRWRPAPSPRSTPPSGSWRTPCRGGASWSRRSPPIALVVGWLVIDGELWDRPDDDSAEGPGEVPSLQHLDAADPDRRGAHLLPRALRGEPGLGAVRPRPRRDGRLPPRIRSATATCSCWPGSSRRRRPSAAVSAPAWSRTRRSARPRTRSARRSAAAARARSGTRSERSTGARPAHT